MSIKLNYLVVALAGLLISCNEEASTVESYFGFDIEKRELDRYLQDEMARLGIPGMAVAFINDGRVVHHQAFGWANLQEKTPVTDQTIFEGASISKSVFAYFVMTYVEEGLLDLDTPLYTYWSYPDIAHDERYKKITARMALSHQTGFPNWRGDLPENRLTIAFEPGTGFLYSGEGYQFLAEVLRHLEDTNWAGLEQRFQEKVAGPLGMEHTTFIQDAYCIANKAAPYDENGEWVSPDKSFDSLFRHQFVAAASIHSEPLDFSKWLVALMNKQGLSQKSFEELFKVHAYVAEYGGIDVDYTLGFYIARLPFASIYTHGGNNEGFTSWFAVDPDKGWGFVLFTNSEYGEELGGYLTLDMLFGPNPMALYTIIAVLVLGIALVLWTAGRRIVKGLQAGGPK